ncbi:MAG: manganese efflux pump [Pseudomonadota bacterium]
MTELLIFGLLAGLDNLQVSASLALLPLERRRLHQLAAAFAASEIGGALIGLLLGRALLSMLAPAAEWLAPTAMLLCGAVVLWLGLRRGDADLARFANRRALLWGLPLSLSLDNVIAGAGIGIAGYPLALSALIVGTLSASMACAGLYAGDRLRRFLPERIELAVGAYLSVLAIRGFWVEFQ